MNTSLPNATLVSFRFNLLFGLLVLLVCLGLANTLILALEWGGPDMAAFRGDIPTLPADLVSVLIAWLVVRQHHGQQRRAWIWIALALTASLVGNLIWAYVELVLGADPFPSIADVFYLLYPFMLLVGILHFPRKRLGRLEAGRLGLDVAIIICAVGVYGWSTFLAGTVESYGNEILALLVSLAYPMMDLGLLGLVLLMMFGGHNQKLEAVSVTLGLGLLTLFLADTAFNVLSATDSYASGTLLDATWTWSSILFVFAAYLSLDRSPETSLHNLSKRTRHLKHLALFMPYLATLVCYGILVSHSNREGILEIGILVGTGLVTLLVIARQVVAITQVSRLTEQLKAFSHELEERVAERTAQLEAQREQLIAAEKLASIGSLTARLAHEVNTPLAVAMNQVHHARELIDEHRASVGDPEVTDADMLEINQELQTTIDETRTSLERIGEYILKVRNQTRNNHTSSLSSFDPIRVARDALSMLEHQAQSARVRLQLEVSHELTLSVRGEAGRLTQVLSNLVVNAIHACEARRDPAGSTVTVRFDPVDGLLQVQVEDNGSGIAETVLPRIFEPLFTTKDASKGTGLGLSIIRDIVRGHFGGEVDVSTKVGCGTTFTVSLPLVK